MAQTYAEKPIFCGNFEYEASERALRELFEKYGRVQRIDMKNGAQARPHKLAGFRRLFGR